MTVRSGQTRREPLARAGWGMMVARRSEGLGVGMETYNIYMDEAPAAGDSNGDEGWEVEFRVVGQSIDDGDPESNAVLAGLDLVDLINLRDALQQEIDNFALTALEAQAIIAEPGEELMP